MARFIALREIKENATIFGRGDFVPGVETEWAPEMIQANVNCGMIYDLHRIVVLREPSDRNRHRREAALLRDIEALKGVMFVADPDHEGHVLMVPVGEVVKPADEIEVSRKPGDSTIESSAPTADDFEDPKERKPAIGKGKPGPKPKPKANQEAMRA